MKKVLSIFLCLLLFGCVPASAEDSLPTHTPGPYLDVPEIDRSKITYGLNDCAHLFTIHDHGEDDVYALCTVCLTTIPVHGFDYTVPLLFPAGQPGQHEHIYIQSPEALRTVLEPHDWIRDVFPEHGTHTYYAYTCALCNDSFEAYILVAPSTPCTKVAITDFHIRNSFTHVYVFQCPACQGYIHEEYDCWPTMVGAPDVCDVVWDQYVD